MANSLDFMDMINSFREEAGEKAHEPRKFIAKVEDEIDDLTGKKFRLNNNQTETAYYELTKDQMMLVGMRESKVVRRRVLDVLNGLSERTVPAIPQTYAEALQLAADQAKKLEEQAPKVEYHDKVLATDNGLTTTEIAAELGMSAISLNKALQDMKVQRKVGGRWVLTVAYINQGYDVEVTHVDDGGKSRHAMKWTEKGRKLIHELMGE
jgi:phage antirepressor YoqD-like protein